MPCCTTWTTGGEVSEKTHKMPGTAGGVTRVSHDALTCMVLAAPAIQYVCLTGIIN